MEHKQRSNGFIPVIVLAVLCCLLKVVCFVVWQAIEYPNDLPLVLLSCVYCAALVLLCFFCGRFKIGSWILTGLLCLEILVVLCAILFHGNLPPIILYTVWLLPMTSGYVLTEFIHSFEAVGQTFSDWCYFGAFVLMQLVFAGLLLVGRSFWKKHRNN